MNFGSTHPADKACITKWVTVWTPRGRRQLQTFPVPRFMNPTLGEVSLDAGFGKLRRLLGLNQMKSEQMSHFHDLK